MSLFERALRYVTESLKELWVRPPHQVPALDGLRALAILLGVCAHCYGNFWTSHGREAQNHVGGNDARSCPGATLRSRVRGRE